MEDLVRCPVRVCRGWGVQMQASHDRRGLALPHRGTCERRAS